MNSPDRNYGHLFPAFRERVERISLEMNSWCAAHLPGYSCVLAEGFRSARRQQELYAQGRTSPGGVVTQRDGVTRPSNHQSCLAADLTFSRGGALTWDVADAAWEYLRHLAHTEGLTSGSDWKTFKDRPHVEWPESDAATYVAAKGWKIAEGLR